MLDLSAEPLTWTLAGFGLMAGGTWLVTRSNTIVGVRMLGVTGILYGARYATRIVETGTSWDPQVGIVSGTLAILGAVSLVGLMLVAPERVRRLDRAALFAAGAVAALMAAGIVLIQAPVAFADHRYDSPYASFAGNVVLHSTEVFALLLLAFRYGGLTSTTSARDARIMSAGLVIFVAYGSLGPLLSVENASFVFATGAAVIAALAWITQIPTSKAPQNERNIGWFLLLVPLASAMQAILLPDVAGTGAVARLVALLIFTYGALRAQFLGLDRQARWGISKSLLAAIFVAVFFVASEMAQEFFGGALGSAYFGIVAAGLLVFAIAPLNRIVEHVAAKAIPGEAPLGGREESFRSAIQLALQAGITRDEERMLARLARDLGIDAARAFELRETEERKVAE